MKTKYALVIIGGGPAGLAAALGAKENGLDDVLIVERDTELGGILNQCIHNGFGLHVFHEELTGPEYALRFIREVKAAGIDVLTDTMVLDLENREDKRLVRLMNTRDGYLEIEAQAVVLAMGCRERTRGAIRIPGTRPAGIYTAGTAQRFVNMEGHMVGRRIIILGSGDIGLIMARRMTLEGAKVLACVELMPFSGGLNRNIVQCLQDYDIPLYLSHTITNIEGRERVQRVTVQEVDENRRPIPGTETYYEVDTVLLSVGLIPENELSRQAGVPLDRRTSGPLVHENMETLSKGIFACGNVLHVHDLVDYVTDESKRAGAAAADFVKRQSGEKTLTDFIPDKTLKLETDESVSYTVPQRIRPKKVDRSVRVFFRVRKIYPKPAYVVFRDEEKELARFKKADMAPGEMQNVTLTSKALAGIKGKVIRVSIEEEA